MSGLNWRVMAMPCLELIMKAMGGPLVLGVTSRGSITLSMTAVNISSQFVVSFVFG